jgi:hypothetical protein
LSVSRFSSLNMVCIPAFSAEALVLPIQQIPGIV